MNINPIALPTAFYIVRSQWFIVSRHFLKWELSFPGEGTIVSLNGNERFLLGNEHLPYIKLMLDLYGLLFSI